MYEYAVRLIDDVLYNNKQIIKKKQFNFFPFKLLKQKINTRLDICVENMKVLYEDTYDILMKYVYQILVIICKLITFEEECFLYIVFFYIYFLYMYNNKIISHNECWKSI